MNTERTSATAFITKEIHMALAQPFLLFMVVPQAIMVGRVTHWKPAYVKALRMALGMLAKPVVSKSAARTEKMLLSLLKMPMT